MHKGFLKAGHLPTLFVSFLYFDLSFMVWVILGPLGVAIAKQLHLDAGQKGLMVATPVLAGAALRVVLGLLVDRYGAKRVGVGTQIVVIAGLIAAWTIGIDSFPATLLLGCVLGLAGASFAVALPLASAWYPPQHQGKALGIAGAGNSGTVLAALFAPMLAIASGWQNVIGLAAIADPDPGDFHLRRQGQPERTGAEAAVRLFRSAEAGRLLVVHVLLQRNVRRLRRPRLIADHLFQRCLWLVGRLRRLLHRGSGVHRVAGSTPGRSGSRSRWRGAGFAGALCGCGLRLCDDRQRHFLDLAGLAGVPDWHACARHGQWLRFSTRSATF